MIGDILIIISCITAFISAFLYYKNLSANSNNYFRARIFFHINVTTVILASVYLLYLILNHQFQYNYVYNNSSTDLPLGLLISTFYAGQEGSFLFWALCLAIIGIFLHQFVSKKNDLEPRVMIVYLVVQGFILLLLTPLVKNPFTYLWATGSEIYIPIAHINQSLLNTDLLQNSIFTDNGGMAQFLKLDEVLINKLKNSGFALSSIVIEGKSLNPLLQNFWMQIHPPILFIGFALSAVPFAFTLASLIKNDFKNWISNSLPWILMASLVLGLGIMLGGYWAYGVLGWGGYWGWDPVENSSLIPWIISVALVHTMLVQKRGSTENGQMPYLKTNIVLSVLFFILVVYSTFLTRSGVLSESSVHSFVAPGFTTYLLLLIFLLLSLLVSVVLIVKNWKKFPKIENKNQNYLSKELSLFAATVLMIASALVIFVGTSSPIFLNRGMEIKFYNDMNLPLVILMGLLNGISVLLKWKETESKELLKKLIPSTLASVIATIVIIASGVTNIGMILFAFSSFFTLFVNLEIIIRIIKDNWKHLGSYLAHIGIGLFFLGVLASSKYDETLDLKLVKNKPNEAFGYKIEYTGYKVTPDQKYIFDLTFTKDGSKKIINPVMFWNEMSQGVMKNPDIDEGLFYDIYISPLGLEESDPHSTAGNMMELKKGTSQKYLNYEITFIKFVFDKEHMNNMSSGSTFSIGALIEIKDGAKTYSYTPSMSMNESERKIDPIDIKELNWKMSLESLNASDGTVVINIQDANMPKEVMNQAKVETFEIQISKKPFVSFVWIGTAIVIIGFIISFVRRKTEV